MALSLNSSHCCGDQFSTDFPQFHGYNSYESDVLFTASLFHFLHHGGGGRGGPSGIAWLTGRGLCFEEKNLGLSPRLHCVPKLFPCHEHENESPQGIMRTNKTKFWYGRHSISDSSETMGIIQVIMPQERVKEMLFPYRWQKSGFF